MSSTSTSALLAHLAMQIPSTRPLRTILVATAWSHPYLCIIYLEVTCLQSNGMCKQDPSSQAYCMHPSWRNGTRPWSTEGLRDGGLRITMHIMHLPSSSVGKAQMLQALLGTRIHCINENVEM